jgi:hypothetical protein
LENPTAFGGKLLETYLLNMILNRQAAGRPSPNPPNLDLSNYSTCLLYVHLLVLLIEQGESPTVKYAVFIYIIVQCPF